MHIAASFSRLTLVMTLGLCLAQAQNLSQNTAENEKPKELTEAQREFSNLPEERRVDFFKRLNEAARLFNQKRIFETMDQIHEIRKIFDKSSDVFNLLGSCYVEFRNFEQAREYFKLADQISPNSSTVLFNLAEMEFVTHNWQRCLESMTHVLKLVDPRDVATIRVIEFKIMLCHLALNQKQEAEKLAEKYDPISDDSPFYYYAQAALCYRDKNLIKAEEWLSIASRVFQSPAMLAAWQDTMIEFGYVKSYYGGQQSEE